MAGKACGMEPKRFDRTASDAQTRAAVMRLRRHFLYIVYSIQKSHPCQGEFWAEKILCSGAILNRILNTFPAQWRFPEFALYFNSCKKMARYPASSGLRPVKNHNREDSMKRLMGFGLAAAVVFGGATFAAAADGGAIFKSKCSTCYGPQGQGTKMAPASKGKPKQTWNDDEVRAVVAQRKSLAQ